MMMMITELCLSFRMAEYSDLDDAALCKVAAESELEGYSEALQQSDVLKRPTKHLQAIEVLDLFLSEMPRKDVPCDIKADVIHNYGSKVTGSNEHDGTTGFCSNNNQEKASTSDDDVCCSGKISHGDAPQNVTSNSSGIIIDGCVEENPCQSKVGCLPDTDEVISKIGHLPVTDAEIEPVVDSCLPSNLLENDSVQIASKEQNLDGEDGKESLTSKCSANSGDLKPPDNWNSDDKGSGNISAENLGEGCSAKPQEPPSDKKPPQLNFSSDVLLVAPTGKAANVLGRRTGIQAFTLHQVIFSYRAWSQSEHKSRIGWKFDMVRVLVVDESSLVAVTTFHSLISKVMPSLQKVVLLGDILQLPSIEPGTVLILTSVF